jgi:hypothetical protein
VTWGRFEALEFLTLESKASSGLWYALQVVAREALSAAAITIYSSPGLKTNRRGSKTEGSRWRRLHLGLREPAALPCPSLRS